MTSTADKVLLYQLFEAINAGAFGVLEQHPGFWETRQVVPPARRSFRDWRTVLSQQIAEAGNVFSSVALEFTHYGPFAELAPTNRRVTLVGFSLDQVVGEIVVEHNSTMSWPSVLRQLGAPELAAWPEKLPHSLREPAPPHLATPSANEHNKAAVGGMLDSLCRGKPGVAGRHRGALDAIHEFAAIRRAFPDLEYELVMQVGEGDLVGTRATLHGTHAGPLHGIAPTNRTISWDYFSFARVAGGTVVEHAGSADWTSGLLQLGAMPLG